MKTYGTIADDNDVATKKYVDQKVDNAASSTKPSLPPTSYFLDRSETPWVIVFNNGSKLRMPEYKTTVSVYGYGFSKWGQAVSNAYPIPDEIINIAQGSLTIETLQKGSNSNYWGPTMAVENPMNDANDLDFTNATFGDASDTLKRGVNKIRVLYELGIFNKQDCVGLGAKIKS